MNSDNSQQSEGFAESYDRKFLPSEVAAQLGLSPRRGWITCPFHADENRAMRCNDKSGKFHCASVICSRYLEPVEPVEFYAHLKQISEADALMLLSKSVAERKLVKQQKPRRSGLFGWECLRSSAAVVVAWSQTTADELHAAGVPAVAISPNGGWKRDLGPLFADKIVAIIPEDNLQGIAAQVVSDLKPHAKVIQILDPDVFAGAGVLDAEQIIQCLASLMNAHRSWEPPSRSLASINAIPRLDAERMLPRSLRGHLLDLADDLQCPVDALAAAAFAGLSTLIGRKLTVKPKEHSDYLISVPLWFLIIAEPGQRKTQIVRSALAPFYAIERAFERQNQEILAQQHAQGRLLLARERDLDLRMQAAQKAGKQDQEAELLAAQKKLALDRAYHAAQGPRQYIVRDATPEKLLEILVQNPNGVLIDAEEVPGWWRTLKTSTVDMRKLILEGAHGMKILVQRKSYSLQGESTIAVAGGAQPGWLAALLRSMKSDGRENDGLINRFSLLINHESPIERWSYSERVPDPESRQLYDSIFWAFHSLKTSDVIEGWQPGQPNSLRFSEEGQALFRNWLTRKENAIRKRQFPQLLASHASKYTSLFGSLALIFHLVRSIEGVEAEPATISIQSARYAEAWCEHLFHHAHRTFSETRSYLPAVRELAAILARRNPASGVTAAEIFAEKPFHITSESHLEDAIKPLAGLGLVIQQEFAMRRIIFINPHESTTTSAI